MSSVLPLRKNRQAAIETVFYETDRNNETRIPLKGVTSAEADWDIDRAGSKSRIDIATHKRVLRDYQWIAPYLRIVPEVGDVIEQQMGHFLLSTPSTTLDRTVDKWGDEVVQQQATGTDIMDVIAKAKLTESFYTPVNGMVMSDVQVLLQMATSGLLGPNLLTNGSFENDAAGWTGPTWELGGNGSFAYDGPAAHGEKALGIYFDPGTPPGGRMYVYQTKDIPAGARFVYMSAVTRGDYTLPRTELRIIFLDSSGSQIPDTRVSRYYTAPSGRWQRGFVVGEVPPNAVQARFHVFQEMMSSPAGGSIVRIDDVRAGVCTAMPIPLDRINLPQSNAYASTRIQTAAGQSFLYQAINADRLNAISMYAAHTDLEGRITTSPSDALGRATAIRQYTSNDCRFIGVGEVGRSADSRYNVVIATKESFEEDVPPMVVTVFNDDPSDPWSVHGELGNIAEEIMVQDAVTEADLEAAARATLARAMEQHTLRITVRPDPGLAIHSVIEILDGPEEARGRWLVEYLRPGLMASDVVVEIGARRSSSSVGVVT